MVVNIHFLGSVLSFVITADMDMSKVFTEMNIDVKSMNVRTSKQGTATIEAGFIVRGREELGKVIGKLRQIVGVLDIERAVG